MTKRQVKIGTRKFSSFREAEQAFGITTNYLSVVVRNAKERGVEARVLGYKVTVIEDKTEPAAPEKKARPEPIKLGKNERHSRLLSRDHVRHRLGTYGGMRV